MESHILHAPLYEYPQRPARKRTLSWADIISPGSARMEVPLRLMSPQLFKKTSSPHEIERKQARAQELRESLLNDKTSKLKSKAEKVQAVRLSQIEQAKLLRESIEEKQAKAEKVSLGGDYHLKLTLSQLRDLYIKGKQDKAKDERAKVDEIAVISAQSLENRKNEVQQRHLDSEARLQEMEEERQRKLSEMAALQEAALERRRAQEAERLAKRAREEEKKREIEAKRESERQEILALKKAKKEERMRRLAELKSLKQAEAEETRRELYEKLNEKLEKGTRRHDEILEQKKEKAAQANQNAKVIANSMNARRTPENPMNDLNQFSPLYCMIKFPPEDGNGLKQFFYFFSLSSLPLYKATSKKLMPHRDKSSKRRAKRFRQRMRDSTQNYSFIPSSSFRSHDGKHRVHIMLDRYLSAAGGILSGSSVVPDDLCFETILKDVKELNINDIEHISMEGGLAAILTTLLSNNFLEMHEFSSASIRFELTNLLECFCGSSANVEYVLRAPEQYAVNLADALANLVAYIDGNSGHLDHKLQLAADLFNVISRLVAYDKNDTADVAKAKESFICYVFSLDLIENIRRIFSFVNGPDLGDEVNTMAFLSGCLKFLFISTDCQGAPAELTHPALPGWKQRKESLASISVETFRASDMVSTITLLVSLVLYNGRTSKSAALEPVSDEIIELSLIGVQFLNNLSLLDVAMVQLPREFNTNFSTS
ncbi:hypothetical protein HDU76_007083 [Blyttiomyces sp. JEL0837]|nr:hypothetical protein HDU76_007083 [Blyttiomyces sp. JEL0837]